MYLMNLGILNQGPSYSFPTSFTSISRAQSHPDSIIKLWCREQDLEGKDLPAQGSCLRTISQPHKNTSLLQFSSNGGLLTIHTPPVFSVEKKGESIGMAGLIRTNLSPKLQKFTQPKCRAVLNADETASPGVTLCQRGWKSELKCPSLPSFKGCILKSFFSFINRIESHLSTAVTNSRFYCLFSIPCLMFSIPSLLLPGIITQKLPALKSLSQALLLGEHKLRCWSN